MHRWTKKHCSAARKEGWDIFECFGSSYGRWQLCRVDEADENHTQLDSDDDAWTIVMFGTSELHRLARAIIQDNNPADWRLWVDYLTRSHPDRFECRPDLKIEIIAALLTQG